MPRNYNALPKAKKDALKPVVKEIRKHLYGTNHSRDIIGDGLVINFGKGDEARHTIKVEKVA